MIWVCGSGVAEHEGEGGGEAGDMKMQELPKTVAGKKAITFVVVVLYASCMQGRMGLVLTNVFQNAGRRLGRRPEDQRLYS
jgi:hypothetical protein